MATQIARHDIKDQLYIYLQDNSKKWYCRFVLHGKWYSKSTKIADKDEAIAKANMIYLEHKIKYEHQPPVRSKRFKDIANKTIEKLRHQLDMNTGKVIYKDYIGALKKYHIPFFDRTYITAIDQSKISEFEVWRRQHNKGLVLAKSTILTHNAALQLVFKEAIENKWMIAAQVPTLSNDGGSGQRRASFTEDEYDTIYSQIESSIDSSRKKVTRQIRGLLLDYMDIAINTGIRPGTELENLTWGDIEMVRQDHQVRFRIKVTKGKTTKHTGTRTVVCNDDIIYALENLRNRFPNRRPKDKLLVLENGDETKELSNVFSKALIDCDLKDSKDGPRTLYSLRHSYITWQLLKREIRLDILARQCGTSVAMIEQHYSHVVPQMFEEELSGVKFEKEAVKGRMSKARLKKTHERLAKRFEQWEREYKVRGCI